MNFVWQKGLDRSTNVPGGDCTIKVRIIPCTSRCTLQQSCLIGLAITILLHSKLILKMLSVDSCILTCLNWSWQDMVFQCSLLPTGCLIIQKMLKCYRMLTVLHTYIHPFNGPLSGTTRVSRYQKGRTNLDFTEARDSEWQWHQLGHIQVCSSLQTDNHASTPPLSFFTGRMPFLLPNQQRQSIEGKCWQFYCYKNSKNINNTCDWQN